METNTKIDPTSIPGAVIDPVTGRLCATQMDIFRALGLSGRQVKDTGARRYQYKFYDILDVVEGRKQTAPRGRRPASKPGIDARANLNTERAN